MQAPAQSAAAAATEIYEALDTFTTTSLFSRVYGREVIVHTAEQVGSV